jgi:hypothetical protein
METPSEMVTQMGAVPAVTRKQKNCDEMDAAASISAAWPATRKKSKPRHNRRSSQKLTTA